MKVEKITTKNKRFTLIDTSGFDGVSDQKVWDNWIKKKEKKISKILEQYNYSEIPNGNGGDDDFLCFDHLKKEYIWCEYGFYPFSKYDLEFYENQENIDLKYLYSIRQ